MPEVEQSAAQPAAHSARRLLWLAVGIIVVAAGWRAVIAATMPCIARDSVTFCEYARDLGNEGWAYLRRPTTHQHPLFPLTVLATQRLGRVLGVADSPLTWQRSGQVVAGLAGLALVLLAGLLTRRLVRRVELPIDPNAAAVGALALAALLPLNIWLSAEVMSDQLHAAFYLLGAWAMLRLERTRSAALCGVAGALAYLTRPEGLVVILAALAALVALRIPWRRRLLGMFTLLAAFGVCASPYWLATGDLTAKLGKNPLDWLRGEETVAAIPAAHVSDAMVSRPAGALTLLSLAKLQPLELPAYALLPWVLYTLFRAGRVVVPLLAAFPLVALRRQALRPPLVGLIGCMVGHLTLTLILLHQHSYLAPRHLLVVVMLLLPFAAIALIWPFRTAARSWQRVAAVGLVIAALLPLAGYSLRVPNAADDYLPEAARELARQDPEISAKRIMSGSSPRRVVFYAGARWLPWYEAPEYLDALRRHILAERPDYFLFETGTGYERAGNEAVLTVLESDPDLAGRSRRVLLRDIPGPAQLHAFAFDWGDG